MVPVPPRASWVTAAVLGHCGCLGYGCGSLGSIANTTHLSRALSSLCPVFSLGLAMNQLGWRARARRTQPLPFPSMQSRLLTLCLPLQPLMKPHHLH